MIKPGSRPIPVFTLPLIGAFLICLWLAACASASAGPQAPTASSLPASPPSTGSPVPIPSLTPTPARAAQPSIASPTPGNRMRLCSPFPGASQADLIAVISNPYNPPPPGSDDPHQGVDLAVQQNGIALAGGPALAVLSGRVAMVTEDRFPYGYTLLVETPLKALQPPGMAPPGLALPDLALPTPAPTRPSNPVLTCPAVTPQPSWDSESRSLYLLYAHLQEQPAFQPGDEIQCGQTIGRIGQSGNALNPHLHLEVRVGPAGALFSSMAHYDNTATPEEMGNYCLWRVSDVFQLVDPLRLLAQLP